MFGEQKPQASVNIPTDVLTPIIQARVSEVLINTLGDKSKILEEAVKQVLMARVNNEGKRDNYDSYNKIPLANQKSKLIQQLADALVGKITNERLMYNIAVTVAEKQQY